MSTTRWILLLGVLVIGAAPGYGNSFTGEFDDLEAELIRLRDNEFAGALDRAEKKKLKAITKSLLLIAKDADELVDDFRTAGKVEKLLFRVFDDEYEQGPSRIDDLYDDLFDIRGELPLLFEDERRKLEALQHTLTAKGHKKVRKLLVKSVRLELKGLFQGKTWKRYEQAFKSVLKGRKVAGKTGGGGGVPGLRAQVIDRTIVADDPRVEYDKKSGDLRIVGTATLKGGTDVEIDLTVYGVFAVGTYLLAPGTYSGSYIEDGYDEGIHPEFGRVTVTTLDPDAPHITGVFEFVAGLNSGSRFLIQVGEFNLTNVTVTGG